MSYSNPSQNEDVFDEVGKKVLGILRNKVSFPREVIWLIGPNNPMTKDLAIRIAETRTHRRNALNLEFKGMPFEQWFEMVLTQIAGQSSRDGIVVNNFFVYPEQCVACLYYVHKFMTSVRASKQRRGRPLPYTKFHFLVMKPAKSENELPEKIRENAIIDAVDADLKANYSYKAIDLDGKTLDAVEAQVSSELSAKNHGQPIKYDVAEIPIFGVPNHNQNLHRSNTWHAKNSRGQNYGGSYRGNRTNTMRSQYDAPMSPYGYHHAGGYPSMQSPFQHGREESPRFPSPKSSRSSYGGHRGPAFTFPDSARGYGPGGTPRESQMMSGMPTSCRLTQLAESDRHSFFPSSSRSNYQSMRHTPVSPVVFNQSQQDFPSPMTPAMRRVSIKSTDSSKIRDVFLQICAKLEATHGKENLVYPKEIIWMIGPPGAGKSTLAGFLTDQRKLQSTPIVLREICQSVIAKNGGKLKIDQVVEELMIKLLEEEYQNGVVVDGFVSITCARVVPFMFKYFHEIHDISQSNVAPPRFKFCVLYVNEDNSVRRQLVNYEQGEKQSNRKFDAEDGRKLYRKFLKRTQQVVELIEMHFNFRLIDANGTLAQVQLMASTEISTEGNGALNHDATLVKALSPASSQRNSRRQNSFRGNSYRQNSFRQNTNHRMNSNRSSFGLSRNGSHGGESFRLAPRNSTVTFHSNLSQDISKHVTLVEDREMLKTLQQTVLELTQGLEDGGQNRANNRLPSSKLVPLTMNNVDEISAAGDYVVRPNIRGTHCMMYWDQSGSCFLIDRRFHFFTLKSDAYVSVSVGEGLLDGVMVCDKNNNLVFVAHDAASHQSRRLKDCWFSQRAHECRTAVNELNQDADGDQPIAIVYLDSAPYNAVADLAQSIKTLPNNGGRVFDIAGHSITTHGLAFVPDKAGFHARDGANVFTWPFREEATRDFKIKAPYETENVLMYLLGARNVDSLFQRSALPAEHNERYQAICQQAVEAGKTEYFIMSCEFEKGQQMWVPVRMSNKNRASPINAVAENMSAFENRVTLEEMFQRLSTSI